MKPIHYRLHIEPNLASFDFQAWVEIDLISSKPTREVVLNAVDLEIISCELAIVQQEEKTEWSLNSEKQELLLRLPHEVVGDFRLILRFKGIINNQMLGFYRSEYNTSDGSKDFVASTQFEEAEARKAFPCMDHPSYRSTFDIEMLIPKNLKGFSNMPVEKEEIDPDSTLITFQTTPPMPTYLLFFACGNFEVLDSIKNHHLRGITTSGKIEFVKEALEVGHASVEYCEESFGTDFPLPKLDLMAVPDFAFGAMENWGAMTFRENLLLTYPDVTSLQDLHRIYEVIAHEIVHQWFGDLVSPDGWNYLWLNESFATLFAFKALDHIRPEWKNMEQFIYSNNLEALKRDGLTHTIPIELKEDSRITSATAPIIYNKGGAVLNMLIHFLGEDLSPALKTYFENHAYSNAKSADLWQSLAATLPELPIAEMMEGWITRPGYPLLHVEKEGSLLKLKQERFNYLGEHVEGEWIIPLSLNLYHNDGSISSQKVVMEQNSLEVSLPRDVSLVVINSGKNGFFRTLYHQPENLDHAMEQGKILPMDRFDRITDVFALTESGHYTLTQALDFAEKCFRFETEPLNLLVLLGSLRRFRAIFLNTPQESKINTLLAEFTEKLIQRFGLTPQAEESLSESQLRELLYLVGTEQKNPEVIHAVQTHIQNRQNLPTELAGVILKCGVILKPDFANELINEFDTISAEQQRIHIVQAIGKVATLDQARQITDLVLQKIPMRIQYLAFSSMGDNPALLPELWGLFEEKLETLEKLHHTHYERILVQWISRAGIFNPDRTRRFLKDYDPTRIGEYGKVLPESIEMATELMEIATRLRDSNK